ncbi:spore germination protein, partial [Bacillus sp. SIMBA_074]
KTKELIESINACSLMDLEGIPVFSKLADNIALLKKLFGDCSDFVIREFKQKNSVIAIAVFVDGLIDTHEVNLALKTLMVLEDGDEHVRVIEEV